MSELTEMSSDRNLSCLIFFVFFHDVKMSGVLFSDLACSVAGITSDANVLTNELRLIAQR